MGLGDHYRIKAAEMTASAVAEPSRFVRVQLEWLAASYRRLAEQADRNGENDLVYEPPPERIPTQRVQQQQQQQQQPQGKSDEPDRAAETNH
jgi:hypothetical protein